MNGLQLTRLLDVLTVTSVRNATGVSPRSIVVRGEDFRNVETVLINGTASPSFVAYSTSELIAEVPEAWRDESITAVAVMSSRLTFTTRSIVNFTVGTKVRKVNGVLRLMQQFLRILLRTPGSNVFARQSGGGLLTSIGSNISARAAADIAVAVNTARSYLIGVQTIERNLPPNERLLSAEISALDVDPRGTSIAVTIVLTNHSGQRTAATLTT
jgi:hypothetical protein